MDDETLRVLSSQIMALRTVVVRLIAVNMAAAPPDQRQEIVQSLRGGEVTIPQLTEPLAEAFSDIYIRTQDEIEQIIADAQDHLR